MCEVKVLLKKFLAMMNGIKLVAFGQSVYKTAPVTFFCGILADV